MKEEMEVEVEVEVEVEAEDILNCMTRIRLIQVPCSVSTWVRELHNPTIGQRDSDYDHGLVVGW